MQATHFQVLWGCAECAGILNPSKVCVGHVGFGVLLGEDKMKFKTRSGESMGLVDPLDEGICSETLHYFLVSTLLAIVWQNCVVTSHHYRHFCDRLWQV